MRPLHWIGDTLKIVRELPEDVRYEVGFALFQAQQGGKAVNAVPLVGFGSSKVLEVIIDGDGDTYRAIYTVKFQEAIYALHAFQKKSKKGVATPKPDTLKAEASRGALQETLPGGEEEGHRKMSTDDDTEHVVFDSSGDVFADIGLQLSEQDMLKVSIASAISHIINTAGCTQAKAAEIMNLDQPKVSKLLRGRLKEFSSERLIECLLLLGYDLELHLHKTPRRERGRVRLMA
jgi:phage-related protein/predicted XRE-type DNA-binding protein